MPARMQKLFRKKLIKSNEEYVHRSLVPGLPIKFNRTTQMLDNFDRIFDVQVIFHVTIYVLNYGMRNTGYLNLLLLIY